MPKIGPALAEAIIAQRPYKTLQELAEIKGISPRLVEQLESYLKISPLDPNTASFEELEKLPRISPQVAARIIAGRPYSRLEELREIKGVGRQVFQLIKPHLMISQTLPTLEVKPEPLIAVGDHVQSIFYPSETPSEPITPISPTPEPVAEAEPQLNTAAQPEPAAAPPAAAAQPEIQPNRAIQIIAPETGYTPPPVSAPAVQSPSWRRAEWLPWVLLSSLAVFILTTAVNLSLLAIINGRATICLS